MINNLIVFCQMNHFKMLGILCLSIVSFVVLLTFSVHLERRHQFIASLLIIISSALWLFSKCFLWVWLIAEVVVILSKILVF